MATKEKTVEDQVVELRDGGAHWATIANDLGIGQGKAAFIYMCAKVPPNQRLTAKDDEALGKLILKARDNESQSWGQIAARAGIPEGKVKRLYTEASGTPTLGLRIGKGGRHPGDGSGTAPAKKAAAVKKGGTRPEPAKVSAADAKKPLAEMSLTELKNRLNGKTITVKRMADGGKTVRLGVKNVKSIKNGELNFTDNDGAAKTVLVTEVKSATR